jgi:hypothetical protein
MHYTISKSLGVDGQKPFKPRKRSETGFNADLEMVPNDGVAPRQSLHGRGRHFREASNADSISGEALITIASLVDASHPPRTCHALPNYVSTPLVSAIVSAA